MLIGLVGAPNKGKSTLFSAMTLNEAQIADYPFTTINPNKGVAYSARACVHKELHVQCKARNSLCADGTRMLPINLVDVAGLIEGAHEGKGMGNQFLNDLASADCLIIVTDASGKSDPFGNKCDESDPVFDVKMVQTEITAWISDIIHRNIASAKKAGAKEFLAKVLASFKVNDDQIDSILHDSKVLSQPSSWSNHDVEAIAKSILEASKPSIIAANKADVAGSEKRVELLNKEFGSDKVVMCSGAVELALRKAAKQGLIDYTPGTRDFKWIKEDPSPERRHALEYMQNIVKTKGTNVQELLNKAVFELLDLIVVYPVEDENKYSDHFGNVLPDAILLKRGSTALQLAEKIHTSIAKSMLYAIDARTKMRLSKDYVLKDNDVVKIVSAAK